MISLEATFNTFQEILAHLWVGCK